MYLYSAFFFIFKRYERRMECLINSKLLEEISTNSFSFTEVTPKIFTDSFASFLAEDIFCHNIKGLHTFSLKCCQRLNFISAVKVSLDYDFNQRDDPLTKSLTVSSPSTNNSNDAESHEICIEERVNNSNLTSITASALKNTKEVHSMGNWYREVNKNLLQDSLILQLMSLFESNQCSFACHIIEKILCTCAIYHNKLSTILKFIQERWKENRVIKENELQLICALTLCKQSDDQNIKYSVQSEVFSWFDIICLSPEYCSLNILKMMKETQLGLADFQIKNLCLFLLKLRVKYSIAGKTTLPCYLSHVILDLLKSHTEIFFNVDIPNQNNGELVFSSFVKILNKLISIDYCLEMKEVFPLSSSPFEIVSQVLLDFPSLFEQSKAKKYLNSINFWGKTEYKSSTHPHLVIAQQLFVMISKTVVFLSCKSRDRTNGDVLGTFLKMCENFLDWMQTEFSAQQLELGWIPFLFGDQDDQWITALLCLLIFYQELSINRQGLDMESRELLTNSSDCCDLQRKGNSYNQELFHSDDNTSCLPQEDLNKERSSSSSTKESNGISNRQPEMPACEILNKPVTGGNRLNMQHKYVLSNLCPFRLFLQFVTFIAFDPLVIADFLTSPETKFLHYFVKILQHIVNNWTDFINFCHSSNEKPLKQVHKTFSECANDISTKASEQEDHMYKSIGSGNNLIGKRNIEIEDSSKKVLLKFVKMDRECGQLVSYSDSENSDEETVLEMKDSSEREDDNEQKCFNLIRINNIKNDSLLNSNYVQTSHARNVEIIEKNNTSKSESCSDCTSNIYIKEKTGTANCNVIEFDEMISDTVLDCVMTMFIRLRFHIEKLVKVNLFPYNPDLLLSLIGKCEDKYENV